MSTYTLEGLDPDNARLLKLVAAATHGGDVDAMLARTVTHDTPGICTVCETVADRVDPDSADDFCEECEENHVVSVLMLAEMI